MLQPERNLDSIDMINFCSQLLGHVCNNVFPGVEFPASLDQNLFLSSLTPCGASGASWNQDVYWVVVFGGCLSYFLRILF